MMMAAEDDPDWMRKLKTSGPVPLLPPEDDGSNGWASPPGDKFQVRGPNYFSDKVKISAGEWLLKPLAFDWIKSPTKIHEVMRHPNSRVRVALEETSQGEEKGVPFVWAFNLQVPSKDNFSCVAYFVSLEPIPEGSLMDQFLKGDETFRNSRLKLIANIVNGPWIVKAAVGEQAICILGKAVACKYYQGDNFMEVDVDIGASMLANAVVHLAFGYVTTLTVDLAFLIESQVEEELPERVLGAIRFANMDPASARSIDQSSEEDMSKQAQAAPSLTSRWWKSFSTYINGEEPVPSNQTGAAADSSEEDS